MDPTDDWDKGATDLSCGGTSPPSGSSGGSSSSSVSWIMSELEDVPLGREPVDDLLVVRTADTRLGCGSWVGGGRRGCGCMVSSSRSTSASVLRFALMP